MITERGRPVARLVRYSPDAAEAFPGRSAFRRKMPRLEPRLSRTLVEEREDRL